MSTALKWGIAIIVLAGAGWLLWWSGWLKNTNQGAMQAAVATSGAATTTQATSTPPAPLNGMSASNDSSDGAVAQDAAAIDTQMQALGKDSARVAASLTDKPITQSY